MSNAFPLPSIFCLMGPTAIGKTELALQLARSLPIEIISVDSAMVYRYMDIGTAKPDKNQLQQTPHHLIDLIAPDQLYSAGEFCIDAQAAIQAIQARGKIPLLVGGTMLYFKSLQQGLLDVPSIPSAVREALLEELRISSLEVLYAELRRVDPVLAAKLHPHDQQRILRGLEVYRFTHKALSLWQKGSRKQALIQYINVIILPADRFKLQQRINARFKQMLSEGFIAEVQQLRANFALTASMNSMRSVGYRQVWDYLEGDCTYEELLNRGAAATRQLAKRQLTWLRTWPEAIFFNDDDPTLFATIKNLLLNNLRNTIS